jgi:bifunctional non-homologous end joining protein LigD
MFEHACKVGLEGVVSKVRDSAYPAGRSNDWVKKTCAQRETLTIAGFALDGSKWDGLYVGRRVRKTQAFAKRISHKGIWVEPKLLAEIEYRAKSAEGHPFFRGLREDR